MRKRVFIISQNEPFYIPKTIRYILEHQDKFEVVGATCLKPHRKNKSMKHWFLERTKIYTLWELMLVFIAMVSIKVFKSGSPWYSVPKLYDHFKVTQLQTEDINGDAYLDELEKLAPDIILSISPPQLFGERLLGLAKEHCLNAHGTLLPRHRGVFGSWWTIFENDKEAGGTIHTMELRLDAGEIVYQEAFTVQPDETQYSIASKTKELIAKGCVEVLSNTLTPIKPVYMESYHRAPTAEQGKEFHRAGKHIITRKNLALLLAEKFQG